MVNVIDVIAISDLKVENGILHVPMDAQVDGADEQITLRLDADAAQNLQARLTAGLVTARVQARQR